MYKLLHAIITVGAAVTLAGLVLGGGVDTAQAQNTAVRSVPFQGAPDDAVGYPMHRNYTPDDYGTQFISQNWAVTQDGRGVIYVANPDGVLAYDGVEWNLIPTERQTLVRTLVSDARGRVFVGAYGEFGALQPDSTGTQHFVSLVDEVSPELREFGHTWSGAATPEGVYFQTRRILFRWDGESMKTWTTGDDTRFFKVFSVRDTLFVSQENVGLRKVVGDDLVTVDGGDRFAETTVTVLLPHGRSELLAGTVRSDLFLRSGGQFRPFSAEAGPFLKENEIHDAVVLPDGTYALATLWGGVLVTDTNGRPLRVLDEDAGLIDDDVKSLFVDRQNGLWMACEKGVARSEVLLPISVYDSRAGLDGAAMSLVRHDGTIHVGTSTGVFRLERSRTPAGAVRPIFNRLPDLRGQAFSMVTTPSGLLVATDRGVFVVRNGRVRSIGEPRAAFGLHRSRIDPQRVYVGYIDGIGRLRWQNGDWERETRIPGLDKGVFFMEEDAAGNLWAASAYSGLWWVDNPAGPDDQVAVREVAAEGETPQHVFRMAYLPDGGGLRIVTRDGVAAPDLARDAARSETGAPPLVADTSFAAILPADAGPILNVEVAPDGDQWIFTPTTRYWVRQGTTGPVIATPLVTVPDFKVYGTMAEAQGLFWMAGDNGVLRHVPLRGSNPPLQVRTILRRVLIADRDSLLFGGVSVEGDRSERMRTPGVAVDASPSAAADTASVRRQGPRLHYDYNSIRIEYAAPGYGREENIQYRYRLAGFDAEWSGWTSETDKEYTNLPPGSYTFTVEARSPKVWQAEPVTYAFSVMPPWYRTTWAYLLYVVLGVGLVAGVVQWRTAHLDRRQQWLERVVTQRTAEVKEQARQLEVYNSELLRSNEELQVAIEEKSKLLGVAAHDLKNPLFGIRALSEVLLEQSDLTDNADRKLNLIRQSADETLRLINDLLASAASTAQASLEVELIDVAALAEWITHSFQPQAERKEQELYCSVPEAACITEGDRRKLREAMNNLISNAIKYSPYGAAIYVEVDRSRDEIYFHVRDEGPGLSEEDQKRMFAPFQRLTPSPTGDEGSSGLGLYIVKKIVELHGGEVDVESELHEGSTFSIILPAVSATPGGRDASGHNGQGGHGDARNGRDGVPNDSSSGYSESTADTDGAESSGSESSSNGADAADSRVLRERDVIG